MRTSGIDSIDKCADWENSLNKIEAVATYPNSLFSLFITVLAILCRLCSSQYQSFEDFLNRSHLVCYNQQTARLTRKRGVDDFGLIRTWTRWKEGWWGGTDDGSAQATVVLPIGDGERLTAMRMSSGSKEPKQARIYPLTDSSNIGMPRHRLANSQSTAQQLEYKTVDIRTCPLS